MSQVPPPGQSDDEIQPLAILVVENLQEGKDPEEIIQQLVDSGWTEDDAIGFVGSIQTQMLQSQPSHAESKEGEGTGWLVWIGGALLFYLMRYLFG